MWNIIVARLWSMVAFPSCEISVVIISPSSVSDFLRLWYRLAADHRTLVWLMAGWSRGLVWLPSHYFHSFLLVLFIWVVISQHPPHTLTTLDLALFLQNTVRRMSSIGFVYQRWYCSFVMNSLKKSQSHIYNAPVVNPESRFRGADLVPICRPRNDNRLGEPL